MHYFKVMTDGNRERSDCFKLDYNFGFSLTAFLEF